MITGEPQDTISTLAVSAGGRVAPEKELDLSALFQSFLFGIYLMCTHTFLSMFEITHSISDASWSELWCRLVSEDNESIEIT